MAYCARLAFTQTCHVVLKYWAVGLSIGRGRVARLAGTPGAPREDSQRNPIGPPPAKKKPRHVCENTSKKHFEYELCQIVLFIFVTRNKFHGISDLFVQISYLIQL